MTNRCSSKTVCFAFALLWLGCGDGQVATDDCVGDHIRCRLPVSSREVAFEAKELSTQNLPEITPTWIHALPTLPPDPSPDNIVLTSDLQGQVWLFTTSKDGIDAARLDDDGAVIDSKRIEPPKALQGTDATHAQLFCYQQASLGPAVRVQWPEPESGTTSTNSQTLEWIKLGAKPDDRMHRIAPKSAENSSNVTLSWTEDGDLYFTDTNPDGMRVDRRDRSLTPIWSQAAFRQWNTEMEAPQISLAWLDSKRAAVFAWNRDMLNVYVLDADGNIGAPQSSVAPVLHPDFPFPQQGPTGPALIAGDVSGDLYMMRTQAKPFGFSGVRVLRSEYLSLAAWPNAVDAAGNIYAAPTMGGREPSDQRRVICRLPGSGEPSCTAIAASPELEITQANLLQLDLAVNAAGVVFLRSQTKLVRIDLPNAS
jgi:hypothetical protein